MRYAIRYMADEDIDFLEGNAPEMPEAQPSRPRSPMTPVPSPRRTVGADAPVRKMPNPQELTPVRPPRDNTADSLEREMRLEEDPLENLSLPLDRDVVPEKASSGSPEKDSGGVAVRVPISNDEPDDIDLVIHPRGVAEDDSLPQSFERPVMSDEPPPMPVSHTSSGDEPPPVPTNLRVQRAMSTNSQTPVPAGASSPNTSASSEPSSVPKMAGVAIGSVQPMQMPRSAEPRRVETPALTVDRSSSPVSELDMSGGDGDEPPEYPGDEEALPEEPPKRKSKLPAWLIVVAVLLVAGGGFYLALPFLVGKKDQPKVITSEIDEIVEAAKKDEETSDQPDQPDQPDQANLPKPADSEQVGDVAVPEAGAGINGNMDGNMDGQNGALAPVEAITPPQSLPVPEQEQPSMVPVRIDRYSLATAMSFSPSEARSGPVTQLGVFNDGGREIYVAKIMYPSSDLPGLSKFTAKVQELADASLKTSVAAGGTATLNGPSALNNPRVPASIYSVAETRTDQSGMEVREIKTYLAVDAQDGCLLFAVQTPDSDTGYGLTKFIEIAQQLE